MDSIKRTIYTKHIPQCPCVVISCCHSTHTFARILPFESNKFLKSISQPIFTAWTSKLRICTMSSTQNSPSLRCTSGPLFEACASERRSAFAAHSTVLLGNFLVEVFLQVRKRSYSATLKLLKNLTSTLKDFSARRRILGLR